MSGSRLKNIVKVTKLERNVRWHFQHQVEWTEWKYAVNDQKCNQFCQNIWKFKIRQYIVWLKIELSFIQNFSFAYHLDNHSFQNISKGSLDCSTIHFYSYLTIHPKTLIIIISLTNLSQLSIDHFHLEKKLHWKYLFCDTLGDFTLSLRYWRQFQIRVITSSQFD